MVITASAAVEDNNFYQFRAYINASVFQGQSGYEEKAANCENNPRMDRIYLCAELACDWTIRNYPSTLTSHWNRTEGNKKACSYQILQQENTSANSYIHLRITQYCPPECAFYSQRSISSGGRGVLVSGGASFDAFVSGAYLESCQVFDRFDATYDVYCPLSQHNHLHAETETETTTTTTVSAAAALLQGNKGGHEEIKNGGGRQQVEVCALVSIVLDYEQFDAFSERGALYEKQYMPLRHVLVDDVKYCISGSAASASAAGIEARRQQRHHQVRTSHHQVLATHPTHLHPDSKNSHSRIHHHHSSLISPLSSSSSSISAETLMTHGRWRRANSIHNSNVTMNDSNHDRGLFNTTNWEWEWVNDINNNNKSGGGEGSNSSGNRNSSSNSSINNNAASITANSLLHLPPPTPPPHPRPPTIGIGPRYGSRPAAAASWVAGAGVSKQDLVRAFAKRRVILAGESHMRYNWDLMMMEALEQDDELGPNPNPNPNPNPDPNPFLKLSRHHPDATLGSGSRGGKGRVGVGVGTYEVQYKQVMFAKHMASLLTSTCDDVLKAHQSTRGGGGGGGGGYNVTLVMQTGTWDLTFWTTRFVLQGGSSSFFPSSPVSPPASSSSSSSSSFSSSSSSSPRPPSSSSKSRSGSAELLLAFERMLARGCDAYVHVVWVNVVPYPHCRGDNTGPCTGPLDCGNQVNKIFYRGGGGNKKDEIEFISSILYLSSVTGTLYLVKSNNELIMKNL